MWEATFEDLCRSARERQLDVRAFAQRRSEFEILFRHVRVPAGRALEVGCGGGFLTALLAREGKVAVGIDMAAPDDTTHSRGMDAPAKVRKALGAPNLHFLGCSGEALCFADGAFDLVLSSYVLEHVADRAEAVREMKRVAGPDALIVALVPAWMERVYAPFIYYPRMIGGILRSAIRFAFGARSSIEVGSRAGGARDLRHSARRPEGLADKVRKFFRVYHPTFPFPRPHGLYRSSTEELLAHRYGRWAGLFVGEGLVIERAFATRIAPTCLLEALSDEADSAVQKRFVGLLGRRGETPWLRRFAYSFCFVLRKPRALAD